jgi:hypothetical protein
MRVCTHPHFSERGIVNVYAGGSAMACVGAASNAAVERGGRIARLEGVLVGLGASGEC